MVKEVVKIKIRLAGGKNSIIPSGVIENLVIEVADGGAMYRFDDCNTTRRFCSSQIKDGVKSIYLERLQKTLCKYPNMNQAEIVAHIKERLKLLEGKK